MKALTTSLVAIILAACNGSEIGNPPFNPEQPGDSGIVLDGVEWGTNPNAAGTLLRFPAGALGAELVSVSATNLDGTDEPQTAQVISGSEVELNVFVRPGHRIRVQGQTDSQRLSPTDVVAGEGTEVTALTHPLGECLLLEAREVTVGASSIAVRVLNGCEQTITFAEPSFRIGGLFLVESTFASLEPNQVGEIRLRSTQDAPLSEDSLFIEATAPTVDGRIITLRPGN